jgi:hypothetical protein
MKQQRQAIEVPGWYTHVCHDGERTIISMQTHVSESLQSVMHLQPWNDQCSTARILLHARIRILRTVPYQTTTTRQALSDQRTMNEPWIQLLHETWIIKTSRTYLCSTGTTCKLTQYAVCFCCQRAVDNSKIHKNAFIHFSCSYVLVFVLSDHQMIALLLLSLFYQLK